MEVGLRQIAFVRTLSTIISQSHLEWEIWWWGARKTWRK